MSVRSFIQAPVTGESLRLGFEGVDNKPLSEEELALLVELINRETAESGAVWFTSEQDGLGAKIHGKEIILGDRLIRYTLRREGAIFPKSPSEVNYDDDTEPEFM